jgi:hypothetical protein
MTYLAYCADALSSLSSAVPFPISHSRALIRNSLTHPLTICSHYTTVLLLYYWEKSCHEDEDVDVYEELKSKF